MIKYRRIRWVGQLACIGKEKFMKGFDFKTSKEENI